MSRIQIFAASKFEAQPILGLGNAGRNETTHRPGVPFSIGPNSVTVTLTGMGTQNATATASKTLAAPATSTAPSSTSPAERPDYVLVTGLCGGLTPSLNEAQVVTYTGCVAARQEARLLCDESTNRRLGDLLTAAGIADESVLGITANRIATNVNDRIALARSGASVVDMETYEILVVAAASGIPVVVLRVVSDSFERELPDFNAALNSQGDLEGRSALGVALGSPVRTLRLLAANRRAIRELTPALDVVLNADWR
jgi:nucleoside phosphorylase